MTKEEVHGELVRVLSSLYPEVASDSLQNRCLKELVDHFEMLGRSADISGEWEFRERIKSRILDTAADYIFTELNKKDVSDDYKNGVSDAVGMISVLSHSMNPS